MFRLKRDFIAANNLSVFRFHDHWHGHKPDGIIEGMAVGLGWKKYQNAENARLFLLRHLRRNEVFSWQEEPSCLASFATHADEKSVSRCMLLESSL